MPGAAVEDDQLADVIASNLASHGHPTATVPMGGPQDSGAVVDSHGAPKGIDALRAADASIMPVAPRVVTTNRARRRAAGRAIARSFWGDGGATVR